MKRTGDSAASKCPVAIRSGPSEQMFKKDVRSGGAVARRSQPRLSRIAKGLRTRCYSPLALARIAKGDGCLHNLPKLSNAMDDLSDLVTGMLGVAIAAIMLVAGELYLVTRPDPPDTYSEPPSIVTSSIEQQPR
jgi:hypothetical protein